MKNILKATVIILITALGIITISQANDFNTRSIMSPELLVTPNPFVFEDTFIGETTLANFTFSNNGTDPLNISDITFTNTAFSIDYTSFTIQPGESGELPVKFTPGSQGFFEGTMQVFSDDPINNPYDVELSGNGIVELNMGWEWIETGFDYILMDIEFPEGQNQIGYSIGQSLTYNGEGIVIKTTDGGSTWTQLTPEGIPGLQGCSFLDVNTGYAAGWDGYLIKTIDGGATWDTIVVQSNIWQIQDVEFRDVNHGIVSAWTDGTFVTADGGLTWTLATGITTAPQMIEYADDNTVFLVGGEDRINRSTDGGLTWTEVYANGNTNFILLGVDFLDSNFGMAVGDYGHLYTTTDGGDTWSFSEPFGDQLLHVPFIWDTDTAWICGTPEMVYKTTDGGTTWDFGYNGNWQKALYRITFTDNYTGFMCGGSGGIVLRKAGISGPSLEITPNPIAFEETYIGETSSVMVNFSNTGNEALDITDITFTDPAFSIDYTSFTIQPGESGELPVNFTPTTSGLIEGVMQIFSNDPLNNPYDVQLSGNGIVELIDGWQWIETGFNFILMDIEFPEGQNQVGYAIGQTYTYNGDGIVIKTTDSGQTWEQITPDGIPGLEEMSFIDMQTGYAAGWDGYVIKTTDGGASWDTLTVANDMWEITDIEFYDEDHGILLEGPYVYLTEDGGETWTQGNDLVNSGYMVDYLNANTLVAVGNENYIYKSVDGGNNWEVKNSGNIGQLLLGVHFLNDQYGMAAGDYGYIFKTTDGGDNWTSTQQVGDQLLHVPFIWDEDTAWVCGTPEMVYKTTDGGINWNSAYNGNWQKALYRITFTDNYTGFMCGGSGGIVLRKEGINGPVLEITPNPIAFEDTYVGESTSVMVNFSNTGNEALDITDITFTDPTFSIDYTSFTIQPGESGELPVNFAPTISGLIEGTMQIFSNDPINNPYEVELSGNGIVELIDGWQYIETGFDFILMDIQFPEGQNQIGYCVGQSMTYNGDGIVIKTTDSGQTWEQITPDGIPGLMGMSFVDINTGYAVGWDDYVIRTTDGGLTWDTLFVDSNMFSFYADVEFYDENNGVILYSDAIYITDDGGDSWTMGNGLNQSGLMIEYLDENTLVTVGNENYIWKSTDGGYNWTLKNSGQIGQILIGVDFLNNQYGMAAGDYGFIFKTTDGGETWTSTQQVGDQLLHVPFIWDEDTAWVCGTPEMVFKTTDGGGTWNNAYNGNWQKALYRITFTDNYTGFMCGGSGGIVLRKEGLAEIPAINVTPDAIAFEDTYVGEIATETLTITNIGMALLEVTDITSTDDAFTIDMTSFDLEPGNNQEIIVTFTPDEEGLFEGILEIENNDPDNGIVEVSISGTGIIALPTIVVEPMEILFDTTDINTGVSIETFEVSNTGIAILTVSSISSSNPTFTVDPVSFDLEPNESQSVEVTFDPNAVGWHEAIIEIENNDPENEIVEVNVSGFGDLIDGLSEFGSGQIVKIYPNPVNDKLYLDNINEKEIRIYDLLGNLKASFHGNATTKIVNISDYPGGIYLVKIIGTDGITTKKIEVIK